MEQLSGYGHDTYCERAKQKIKEACECPDAEIFFISGGTQTNQIVIDAMLQGYEGVIAATTGHVSGEWKDIGRRIKKIFNNLLR